MKAGGEQVADARDPYNVIELRDDAAWDRFANVWRGAQGDTSPLASIIRTVRARGCRTVVMENGYSDLDQASEAEFWSREFPVPHTNVHRVHFFDDQFDEEKFPLKTQDGYLGYAVLALPLGRLIRAMLKPPPCMASGDQLGFQTDLQVADCSHCSAEGPEHSAGMLTLAVERVELFGHDYRLVGVPYCGQEAWHLQCGHSTAWACLYTAHLRGRAPRSSLKQVVDAGSTRADYQRAVSSTGTNLFQLQQTFSDLGMPALVYTVDDLEKDERLNLGGFRHPSAVSPKDQAIFSVVCNYLNSGFPVLAATDRHAMTVIGWRRTGNPDGRIELLVSDHDDVYGVVDTPSSYDNGTGWKYLMIPLLPSVVLSGEAVQQWVHSAHEDISAYVADVIDEVPSRLASDAAKLQERFHGGGLSLRLQLKRRQGYKRDLVAEDSRRPTAAVEALATVRLPDWVWIAEVQDRAARGQGEPCVRAEFLFDTTSPDDSPQLCAATIGSTTWCNWPYDEREMAAPTLIPSELDDDELYWESQINRGSDEATPITVAKSSSNGKVRERHE